MLRERQIYMTCIKADKGQRPGNKICVTVDGPDVDYSKWEFTVRESDRYCVKRTSFHEKK